VSSYYCVLPGYWAERGPDLIEYLKSRGVEGIKQRKMNHDRFLEMANVGGIILCISDTEIPKLLVTPDGEPYIQYGKSRLFLVKHPESYVDEISGKHVWVEV
jgi:hypothetical protein